MQLKETGWKDANWTHLAQGRDMVMNPGITENAANFLISLETASVSQHTVLHEVMLLAHQNCIHRHSMFLRAQSVHCFPPGLLPSQNQIQEVPKTLQCCET